MGSLAEVHYIFALQILYLDGGTSGGEFNRFPLRDCMTPFIITRLGPAPLTVSLGKDAVALTLSVLLPASFGPWRV